MTLPRVRHRISPNTMLVGSGAVFALTLLVLALARWEWLVLLALLPAGAAWVAVLSSINAELQLFLPIWVRARGLSIYQITFAAGLGLGSLLWGAVTQLSTLEVTYLAAAAVMLGGAASVRRWPMRDTGAIDRSPATYWPEPQLAFEPDPRDGPVLITTSYPVKPGEEEAFVTAMQLVRRSRRRTGAIEWSLFREGERAGRFLEVYLVPSWDEHLRQHGGRLTGYDQQAELAARSHVDGDIEVRHMLPARDTGSASTGI
jgi:MFS family permease